MCVVPEHRRSLVAAHLLKAQFNRSAYGCRLYCCWCAQDLRSANEFWEAMGFVPLAFRTGSDKTRYVDLDGVKRTGGRIHIFWQKRIRPRKQDGTPDDTPYWYPSETSGGAVGASRIVLPNPPGTHWSAVKPIVLPAELLVLPEPAHDEERESTTENAEAPRRTGGRKIKKDEPASGKQAKQHESPASGGSGSGGVNGFGVGFGPSPEQVAKQAAERAAQEEAARLQAEAKKKQNTAKRKSQRARLKTNDPALCAYSRELRDRWTEVVSAPGSDGARRLEQAARPKYGVARVITDQNAGRDAVFLPEAGPEAATKVRDGGTNVRRLAA